MHLQEIVNRIDQRLESLGINALEADIATSSSA
jgi:hypothetical protein